MTRAVAECRLDTLWTLRPLLPLGRPGRLGPSSFVVGPQDVGTLFRRRNLPISFDRVPARTIWIRASTQGKPYRMACEALTLLLRVSALLALYGVNDGAATEERV